MRHDLSELTDRLTEQRERLLARTCGEVHDPRLSQEQGERYFALATMTVDGGLSQTADCDIEFPIQSVVKPWLYAIALVDHGDEVHESVGVEPTGEPYDAVVLEETGKPPNPMVNAGALMTASLVSGGDVDERVARVLDICSRAAGRQLAVDEEVVTVELEHGDRNRALAYLMRSHGVLTCPVEVAVEVLARTCAIAVTAVDLARMGAVLAGWGRRPGSTEQVLPSEVVTEVLSVMATCGMYDGSGQWIHRAGLPAKSGVSGALMAVAPGALGLGFYSPPLDEQGNSVRGLLAGEELSETLQLHPFGPAAR